MALRIGHRFKRTTVARFLGIALLLGVARGAIADDSTIKTEAQRTGRSVDSAARQLGQDAKQAAKEVADKAKKVGRDVADAAKKAGNDIADTANRTGSAVKHAAKSGVGAVKQGGQTVKQDRGQQNAPNGASDSKKTDSP
jgi:gas vesicle protein